MGQEFEINLKENNQAWLSLWALIPDKVLKDKLPKSTGYYDTSSSWEISTAKIVSKPKKIIKPKRDLKELIINEQNYVINQAHTILKEIKDINIELEENLKNGIDIDKKIIFKSNDDDIMNLTLLRIDAYIYQFRMLITNLNYEWNTAIEFANLVNCEINVGDENEDLDANQELYIKIKSKNFVGTVSFYSYGIGEGEFLISWLEDEYSVLIELTQVLKKFAKIIYKT